MPLYSRKKYNLYILKCSNQRHLSVRLASKWAFPTPNGAYPAIKDNQIFSVSLLIYSGKIFQRLVSYLPGKKIIHKTSSKLVTVWVQWGTSPPAPSHLLFRYYHWSNIQNSQLFQFIVFWGKTSSVSEGSGDLLTLSRGRWNSDQSICKNHFRHRNQMVTVIYINII